MDFEYYMKRGFYIVPVDSSMNDLTNGSIDRKVINSKMNNSYALAVRVPRGFTAVKYSSDYSDFVDEISGGTSTFWQFKNHCYAIFRGVVENNYNGRLEVIGAGGMAPVDPRDFGVDFDNIPVMIGTVLERRDLAYESLRFVAKEGIMDRKPIDVVVQEILDEDGRQLESYLAQYSSSCPTRYMAALQLYIGVLYDVNLDVTSEIGMMLPLQFLDYERGQNNWPLPKKLTIDAQLDVFPIEAMPIALREYSSLVAKNMGVDVAGIALSILTALSSLLAKKVLIYPKKNDNWVECPLLWVMWVSRSGTKKSAISSQITKFIRPIEDAYYRDNIEIKAAKSSEKIRLEEIVKKARRELSSNPAAEKELKEAQAALEEIGQIGDINIILNDTTPEKMVDDCAMNTKTAMMDIQQELSALQQKLAKGGWELLRGIYLQSWDGISSYTYSTKSGGTKKIDRLAIALWTNTQPTTLEKMVEKIKDTFDDGFLQRSLVAYDSTAEHQIIDAVLPQSYVDGISNIFNAAYNMPEVNGKLTDDAYELLLEKLQTIDEMIRLENDSMLCSSYGKGRGYMVRIAYLIMFFRTKGKHENITRSDLEAAWMVLIWVWSGMRSKLTNSSGIELICKDVLAGFKTGLYANKCSTETIRKFMRHNTTTVTLNAALDLLTDKGYIRTIKQKTGKLVLFNPRMN